MREGWFFVIYEVLCLRSLVMMGAWFRMVSDVDGQVVVCMELRITRVMVEGQYFLQYLFILLGRNGV
jgi:hypothetical protein